MILLTTPTGTVGRKVLRELLNLNACVRVLARDQARLAEEVRERVEVVVGSMDDPGTLRAALNGAEALFWCQPDPVTATDYVGAYAQLSRLAAEAVRACGTARVVAITAAGGPPSRPAGTVSGLGAIEKELAHSGAAVRFLRCGSFFDNLLWQWDAIVEEGRFTLPMSGSAPNPHVATGDIARIAAMCLANRAWSGVAPIEVLGPRDLTYQQMADVLSRAVERAVTFAPADPEDYRAEMLAQGFSPSAAQGHLDMFAYLENLRSPTGADRTNTPTSLEEWLHRTE